MHGWEHTTLAQALNFIHRSTKVLLLTRVLQGLWFAHTIFRITSCVVSIWAYDMKHKHDPIVGLKLWCEPCHFAACCACHLPCRRSTEIRRMHWMSTNLCPTSWVTLSFCVFHINVFAHQSTCSYDFTRVATVGSLRALRAEFRNTAWVGAQIAEYNNYYQRSRMPNSEYIKAAWLVSM